MADTSRTEQMRTLDQIEAAVDTAPTPDELRRLRRTNRMAEAVTAFCVRVGLPEEVADHIRQQLALVEEDDMHDAALMLHEIAEMFASDAEGDEVLLIGGSAESPVVAPTDIVVVAESDQLPTDDRGQAEANVENAVQRDVEILDRTDSRVTAFLRLVYGDAVPESITVSDVITAVRSKLNGQLERRGSQYFAALERMLQGEAYDSIATNLGTSSSAVQQRISLIRQVYLRESTEANASKPQTSSDTTAAPDTEEPTLEQHSTARRSLASLAVATGLPASTVTQQRVREQKDTIEDEPRHVVIAGKIIATLGIPDQYHEALRQHLNPEGTANLQANKDQVVKIIRRGVIDAFGPLTLPEQFALDEGERRQLAAILGIHLMPNDEEWKPVTPMTVRGRVDKLTEKPAAKTRRAEFTDIILTGVAKLADAIAHRESPESDGVSAVQYEKQSIETTSAALNIAVVCSELGFDEDEVRLLVQRFVPQPGSIAHKHASDDLRMIMSQLRVKIQHAADLSANSRRVLDYLTYTTESQPLPNTVLALRDMLLTQQKLTPGDSVEGAVYAALTELYEVTHKVA